MGKEKYCPLLGKPCLKEKCMWWYEDIRDKEEGGYCGLMSIAYDLNPLREEIEKLKDSLTIAIRNLEY